MSMTKFSEDAVDRPHWSELRAIEFYEAFVETGCDRDVVIKKLAQSFRDLASSCEPRCALDM